MPEEPMTPGKLSKAATMWNGRPSHRSDCASQVHTAGECDCIDGVVRAAAVAWQADRVRIDNYQATFDLRWRADMRAIKIWQEAHPGQECMWPNHADLVVWLLDRIQELQDAIGAFQLAGHEMDDQRTWYWDDDCWKLHLATCYEPPPENESAAGPKEG